MAETTIGAVLFDGIEDNPYLNELYDAILVLLNMLLRMLLSFNH